MSCLAALAAIMLRSSRPLPGPVALPRLQHVNAAQQQRQRQRRPQKLQTTASYAALSHSEKKAALRTAFRPSVRPSDPSRLITQLKNEGQSWCTCYPRQVTSRHYQTSGSRSQRSRSSWLRAQNSRFVLPSTTEISCADLRTPYLVRHDYVQLKLV